MSYLAVSINCKIVSQSSTLCRSDGVVSGVGVVIPTKFKSGPSWACKFARGLFAIITKMPISLKYQEI